MLYKLNMNDVCIAASATEPRYIRSSNMAAPHQATPLYQALSLPRDYEEIDLPDLHPAQIMNEAQTNSVVRANEDEKDLDDGYERCNRYNLAMNSSDRVNVQYEELHVES